MKYLALVISVIVFLSSFSKNESVGAKEKLSDYQFFVGNLADLKPANGVIPYSLNTPLFSDYAEKARFVKLPENQTVSYNNKEVLDFPKGTTIIKNFYFPNDFRNPAKGRRIIETRLLIHEESGWKAYEYVWNDEQTDAFLEVAGDTKEVSYVYLDGKKKKHQYSIPNLNQCKGCHNRNEKMSPIGPSARQLNGDFVDNFNADRVLNPVSVHNNQLLSWQKMGILTGLPDITSVPKAPVWNDPKTGSLDERARIWLDINCAHCHRPEGPASTSGLNLSIHNNDMTTLGIEKAPVAAGRGTGDKKYDIVKGYPEESILLYRLESTDPGIMMPEVGRRQVHKESVALIKEWIENMK
ncbi:MAG: hypothetical protein MUF45_17790 [Spirosomaceae bacterium]|jgi:uncharacterized repeat protein (TIGR03806 family)|nr:hypothetical protein [Spirosomataceae bacterium]